MKPRFNSLLIIVILIQLIGCDKVKKEIVKIPKVIDKNAFLYGSWKCKPPYLTFSFYESGNVILISALSGTETNTTYKVEGNKILLQTGDVFTLGKSNTIMFTIPIPEFYSKIDCICTKIKAKQ